MMGPGGPQLPLWAVGEDLAAQVTYKQGLKEKQAKGWRKNVPEAGRGVECLGQLRKDWCARACKAKQSVA